MPTLRLTRTPAAPAPTPKRKPAAKAAPKRKPAAKSAPTRARKPAATAATAATNGGATRGPKLPEGWTQRDFNQAVKDMEKAHAARIKAEAMLGEAQKEANGLALELLDAGIQMSVISEKLDLSRQWMYTMLKQRFEKEGIVPPTTPRGTSKPAARKRAAKKPAAAAKRSPARKAPAAKKAPARKRPAGGGRVSFAR